LWLRVKSTRQKEKGLAGNTAGTKAAVGIARMIGEDTDFADASAPVHERHTAINSPRAGTECCVGAVQVLLRILEVESFQKEAFLESVLSCSSQLNC
jgi:hypothetical protein